jgi:ribonuclease PH
MTESGRLIELQGTAEKHPFSRAQLGELLDLAAGGIRQLCAAQRRILEPERAR